MKEHANLPYPEGTACADVLIVGEKGGSLARRVFAGVYVAIAYKILMSILGLWKDVPALKTSSTSAFPNAVLASEITPEYLGVGYIIGPRIASEMFSGGGSCPGWCSSRSSRSSSPRRGAWRTPSRPRLQRRPGSPRTISRSRSYRAYIRYMGAGAVAWRRGDDPRPLAAHHRRKLPRLASRPSRRERRPHRA